MRILHISDIHGASAAFRKVLKKEKFDVLVVTGDFESLADVKPLESASKPVLAVHGNYYESQEVLEAILPWDINGRWVDIGGWRFVGIGFGEGSFEFEPSKQLIFVTHEPPFGAGDLSWIGPVGNQDFRKIIQKFRPRFWLCGHIHEGRGIFNVGKTVVVNAGSIAEKSYAVIDTEADKAVMKRLS